MESNNKVYVVHGSSGSWEDSATWIEEVFSNIESAEASVIIKTAKALKAADTVEPIFYEDGASSKEMDKFYEKWDKYNEDRQLSETTYNITEHVVKP